MIIRQAQNKSANSFIMSLPINVSKCDVTANEVIQNRPGTESHGAIIAWYVQTQCYYPSHLVVSQPCPWHLTSHSNSLSLWKLGSIIVAGTSFTDVYIFNTKCCVIGERINTIIMIIIEPSTGSKTFSYFVHQSLGINVQILSILHHLMNSLVSWIFFIGS